MARLRNPALLSQYFRLNPDALAKYNVFDPILNADTRLFIDPLLLKQSLHPSIRYGAVENFETHFGKAIKLLKISIESLLQNS